MFYEDPRFPDAIAMGAQGGPRWSTTVVANAAGAEFRQGDWDYPLHAWDVSHGIRGQVQFEAVRAHFLVMRGRLHSFRFKDWADFTCTLADGAVQGLTSTTFQLVKRYASGPLTLTRRIRKPLASGFVLRDGTTPLVLTTDYTLDTTTGVVTTTITRTAANLSWQGVFDVPMRYDTDQLDARQVARNGAGLLHEWASVPLVEDPNA